MKKILLSSLLLGLTSYGLTQQTNPLFSLASIEASDGYEYERYSYNSDNLLEATETLTVDGLLAIDSLFYDQMKNVIQLKTYQLIENDWVYVSYIDYTYDANGNRLSRTNYNSFGGSEFNLGGIYSYTYENDRRIGWEMSMGGNIIEKATLTYDQNGKLLEETVQSRWGNSPFENSWRLRYSYDQQGKLITSYTDYWDGFSWSVGTSDWFYYDEQGNCIEWIYKNGTEIFDKYEYEYDLNYTVDQIIYPYNPEEDIATKSLVERKNKVVLSHWYTQNEDAQLVYVCDYIYNYNTLNNMGINNPSSQSHELLVYPNPAHDVISFSAADTTIKSIDIFTPTGQIVLKKSKLNQKDFDLNISSLNSGVYFARIHTQKGIITKKIMVK